MPPAAVAGAPWQTVYWYFNRWEQARRKDLPGGARPVPVQEGRNPEPSAGLIDSQSVQGGDTDGARVAATTRGKKVNDRKRFIVTDTLGLLLTVVVLTPRCRTATAPSQCLLSTYLSPACASSSPIARSPGGCSTGPNSAAHHAAHRAQACRSARVRRDSAAVGGRADVGLTHRHRRLARDYERDPAVSEAMIRWAAINAIAPPNRPRNTRDPTASTHFTTTSGSSQTCLPGCSIVCGSWSDGQTSPLRSAAAGQPVLELRRSAARASATTGLDSSPSAAARA
jgi:hypothetical protein